MSLATPISLDRLCRLALVNRAGFYRWQNAPEAADRDLDLRDEIQRIALESPITAGRASRASWGIGAGE